MSIDDFRVLVDEHWRALDAQPTTGEHRLRVSYLDVTTAQGSLAVAVDHDSRRHLLVPVHTHRRIRSDLNGPVLQLHKRPLEDEDTYQTYADLACLREDVNDLFTTLCVHVLHAVQRLPENPVKALYQVLDRWKALFRSEGPVLGPEQLAGLFAELLLLSELVRRDPSAHRLWLGPKKHRHDFSTGRTAVEVKAGTDQKGRKPRIHGLDQLEVPPGGGLCLVWFGLHRVTAPGAGIGFLELIEQTLARCDDESALYGLLAEAGYRPSEAAHYRDVRFAVAEERWYQVGTEFPGLTSTVLTEAGVCVSALDVEYTIDLSGETPVALSPEEASHQIDCLVRESM
ncbi:MULTISPECIES: PD-(D/E)XK motif protein [unclassified Streptomyces]|uniref:PD-(D/E)XK motif protein n=1 Tax=unclassified Streptomyces TaxID=2593676 RepID=UPI0030781CE8